MAGTEIGFAHRRIGRYSPVIALGGITAANAEACVAAGASGVAVMGEVMRAADPRASIEALVGAVAGR